MNNDFVSCTVNSCDFTVHALEKKKTQNAEHRHAIQIGTLFHTLASLFTY